MRASLGTPAEVDAFTAEALSALHADMTPIQNGFKVATPALPAGLQLAGRRGADAALLRVAAAAEHLITAQPSPT